MFEWINNIWIASIMLIMMVMVINNSSSKLGDALHVLGLKLKMPLSVKGATLDAVASSFPEFATAMISVIVYKKFDDVGIPTIAGSGVFNILMIPMLSMLFFKGKKLQIHMDKKAMLRDAIFYVVSLLTLIYFGFKPQYGFIGGVVLVGIYVVYVGYLIAQIKAHKKVKRKRDDKEQDVDNEANSMSYGQIFLWTILGIAAIWVGIDAIVQSILVIAEAIKIPAFVVSVLILAAATSIPDTILSVKSAKRGDIDGAVANAVGSNIFNICICLGLPMIVYKLMSGEVLMLNLSQNIGMIVFLFISMIVTTRVFTKKSGAKKKDAYMMLITYIIFIGYIIYQAVM